MPIVLKPTLNPDPLPRMVEVPADATGENRDTARVKIRYFPSGKKNSLILLQGEALQLLLACKEIYEKKERGELLTGEERHQKDNAEQFFLDVRREAVRWGIVDHASEDWLTPEGQPTPFSSESVQFASEIVRVVSPELLKAYEANGMLYPLSEAVIRYQKGEVHSPEEIWGRPYAALEVFLRWATRSAGNEALPPLASANGSPVTSASPA